jgi:YHS domain-containing protein
LAVDPVCGKAVAEGLINTSTGQVAAGAPEVGAGGGAKHFHAGQWWYFCSFLCRQRFLATPDTYVQKA